MLSDPGGANALIAALSWVEQLLLGELATITAVIGIAVVGFGMLSGRLDAKRGLTVVIGCFVLFSAPYIVDGIIVAASSNSREPASVAGLTTGRSQPTPLPSATARYDPYAGAAVPDG